MRNKLIYAADAVIVLICLAGFSHVYEKAGLPVQLFSNSLIVESIKPYSLIMVSDKILAVDGIYLSTPEELEFVLDSKEVGNTTEILVIRGADKVSIKVELVSYYTTRYLVIQVVVASVFIFLALFVYTKRKNDIEAQLFNWVILFSTLIIATTWGRYTIAPFGLGHFIRGVFNLAYAVTAVMFIHFTFAFPSIKTKKVSKIIVGLYSVSILLAVIATYNFIRAAAENDLGWFNSYNNVFNLIRLYFVLCVLIGLVNIIHTYITAREESERRKLRWVLLGLSIGPLSLILFWIIPQIFFSRGLINEELVVLTMLSVPIAFTISIIKYHILNIDQIFKRGTIYTIVLFLVLLIYVVLVSSITFMVGTLTISSSLLASTLAAVVIAALFHPIKEKTQSFVDNKFFHVKYNYRFAERNFIENTKYCYSEDSLQKALTDTIDQLIPNEKTVLRFTSNTKGIETDILQKFRNGNEPLALSEHLELGAKYEHVSQNILQDRLAVILFPIHSDSSGLLGLLSLGRKKSGFRFNLEDVDLIKAFCHQTALALDRINLQQKLILEQNEKSRLNEMNELKSYFVSSVTHELKTPLTSIQMFTELIERTPGISKQKRDEYLEIIKGESSRLSRLIDNVLDITKIEKGIKEYRFETIDLNSCVIEAIRVMHYQLKLKGFQLHTGLFEQDLIITADKDAVIEVIINLISNSIKYSIENKLITLSTSVLESGCRLVVEDCGIGIAKEDLKKIFNPFERANSSLIKHTAGTGLGLALVKHIADAHNAKIEVESEVGKGSRFSITFPLSTKEGKK